MTAEGKRVERTSRKVLLEMKSGEGRKRAANRFETSNHAMAANHNKKKKKKKKKIMRLKMMIRGETQSPRR